MFTFQNITNFFLRKYKLKKKQQISKDDQESEQIDEHPNAFQANLNIANKIENLWMNVIN